MAWFNLDLDQFSEENPDLKREIWNSHQIIPYGSFNDSGWNQE